MPERAFISEWVSTVNRGGLLATGCRCPANPRQQAVNGLPAVIHDYDVASGL